MYFFNIFSRLTGGHFEVAQLLVEAKADVDSQDNRKVSCLMAAFRKGHIKVVKYMVLHVNQFPSDQECMRYIQTVTVTDQVSLQPMLFSVGSTDCKKKLGPCTT